MANRRDSLAEEVSIISSGVKIEGNLQSEGNVRIDGSVLGNVFVNGNLTIGDSSEIRGEIKAKNTTMSGKVFGKITTQEKLKLESKAHLKGDLITKYLIIEEGAYFEGMSQMNNVSPVKQKVE
ncbi:MAG: cell shape determination protein CcmA [Ignavibacteriae bacterium HGW-Ignavibacteriae-3]|nr:MAG: cell shape determination protein CcmA [Ignavibacteriae bacterium HGW-Ignavibacteriae-3]